MRDGRLNIWPDCEGSLFQSERVDVIQIILKEYCYFFLISSFPP